MLHSAVVAAADAVIAVDIIHAPVAVAAAAASAVAQN